MKFRYQAKTRGGELQVGFVEAGSQDAATNILTAHELFILQIEEAEKSHWYDRLGSYFGSVKREDMVIFSRQLAVLLEARLSLNKALATLYEQTQNKTLKEAVYQIAQDVDSGLAFSQALERQGQIFSGFFVSMVRSAEVTGNLDKVIGFLADYIERESIIVGKAKGAMMYPIVILSLFGVVATIMVVYVFPQIKPIFESSGVELPFLTKILLGSSNFLVKWWPAVITALVVMVGVALDYLRTDEGRAFLDDVKIKTPGLKGIFVPLTVTRFANASTMLIKGGVPVAQAMEVVGESVDNVLYRDVLHDVSQDIREGMTLSASLAKHPDYFPALVAQMVAVGETTGQLDQMLARISTYYNRETDQVINNLVDLIQPIVMVFVGLLVGLLFAAVLMPMYKLTGSIR